MASAEAVLALRAKRERELGRWLDGRLPRGPGPHRLSGLGLSGVEAPRRWLDVARAHHLASGRVLQRIGFQIELLADAAPANLGDGEVGLSAPDCEVLRGSGPVKTS
jgi:hypothetical protein